MNRMTLLRAKRIFAAGLSTAAVFCILCAGFGSPGSWSGGAAVAESSPPDPAHAPVGIDKGAALYLRSTVDAAALALGSMFPVDGNAGEERKRMLAASLGGLTFNLGGSVYFTAWQGTRIVYSPMSPDAEGMDFAESLDARGKAFVRRVEEAALNGGGFVGVLLPKAPAGRDGGAAGAARALDDGLFAVPGLCADGHGGACPMPGPVSRGSVKGGGAQPEPVEQMVYSRPVPHSEWHIAAFMPCDASEKKSDALLEAASRQDLLQKGLRLSGLSLAGLAGLLLISGKAGKET